MNCFRFSTGTTRGSKISKKNDFFDFSTGTLVEIFNPPPSIIGQVLNPKKNFKSDFSTRVKKQGLQVYIVDQRTS